MIKCFAVKQSLRQAKSNRESSQLPFFVFVVETINYKCNLTFLAEIKIIGN